MLAAIKNAPPAAWLALIGVLLGSALAIFGSWLTNRSNLKSLKIQLAHQTQSERQRIHRERLEELYVLSGNWVNAMLSHTISLLSVMEGKLDYNQHLEMFLADDQYKQYDYNRVEMIVDIYGADLKQCYADILKARERLNEITADHKAAYRRGQPGQPFIKPFVAAQLAVDEAGKRFKKEIAAHAERA